LATSQHNIPTPGGVQNPDGVFSFIGNNNAKGISNTTAVTFHANPQWSAENFDRSIEELGADLLTAAQPWLAGALIAHREVKKWRFATPERVWPEACWVHESRTLVLAGDAFNGPKVEGAFLSGLAAAKAIVTTFS
jgi:predicted NAD/FAD-dependent oxidoreductase